MKKTLLLTALLTLIFTVPVVPAETFEQEKPEKKTISGILRKTVEKGGWLIVAGEKKFLILNAGEFKGKSWFRVGARVKATGSLRNQPTIFMQGQPFKVDRMVPKKIRPRCGTNR